MCSRSKNSLAKFSTMVVVVANHHHRQQRHNFQSLKISWQEMRKIERVQQREARQWRQIFKIDSIGPLNRQNSNFCMVSLLLAIPKRLGSPMESGTVTIMAIRRYTRTYPPKAWVSTVAVSTSIWIVTTLAVGTISTVQQKCSSRSARKSSLVRPVLHLTDELSFDSD